MMRLVPWLTLLCAVGCGSPAADVPTSSARSFDATIHTATAPHAVVVVVVDDRATPQAAQLRSGVGPALDWLAQGIAQLGSGDPALWHPVDLSVILVPASTGPDENIVSPVEDPALRWTTNDATPAGAAALGASVAARVATFAAAPDAPFQPLARARDVVQLLRGSRPPRGDSEGRLVALTQSAMASGANLAVSIVAASDDESPEAPEAYRFIGDKGMSSAALGVVTVETITIPIDAAKYPRLAAWSQEQLGSPAFGCRGVGDAPFLLFPLETCVGSVVPQCDGVPIQQDPPGIGRCAIEITTSSTECVAARGWIDPVDAADGVRRPRLLVTGERVCEARPVESSAVDACVHDASCANCGSGWCITEVRRPEEICPAGQMPRSIRWVGGVLPDNGSVHTVCLADPRSSTL